MPYSQQTIDNNLNRSLSTIAELRPGSQPKFRGFLMELLNDYGILFLMYSGFRDYPEQWELRKKYLAGGSKASAPGFSWHNFKRGIDGVPISFQGVADWKSNKWETIGRIAKKWGLSWGASFGDKPHIADKTGTTLIHEQSLKPGWQYYQNLETPGAKPLDVEPQVISRIFRPNALGIVVGLAVIFGVGYTLYNYNRYEAI